MVAGFIIDDHYTGQDKGTQLWHTGMDQQQTDLEQPPAIHRPIMSNEGLPATHPVEARDEYGDTRDLHVAGEFPLTIKVDGREVVTLMTLGTYPEKLTLGYLRNQRLIDHIEEIAEIKVDWDRETVDVITTHGEGISKSQRLKSTGTERPLMSSRRTVKASATYRKKSPVVLLPVAVARVLYSVAHSTNSTTLVCPVLRFFSPPSIHY